MDFNEWSKYNLGYTGEDAYKAGQQSKQAEIDALKEIIKVSLDWLEWSSSKNDSAVRRAISSLKGKNNDT